MTLIERKALGRRMFLRGMGAAVALPFLDAMAPALSATPKAPVRMAIVYVPNGLIMQGWNPEYEGPLQALLLQAAFEPVKHRLGVGIL